MVLISVDLPDPEGPHTTTTSPFAIDKEHLSSTWTVPYHFETSRISIMGFIWLMDILQRII
jgi:hypothetical protein